MMRTTRYNDAELQRLLSGFDDISDFAHCSNCTTSGYEGFGQDVASEDEIKKLVDQAIKGDWQGISEDVCKKGVDAASAAIGVPPGVLPTGLVCNKAIDWITGGPQKRRRARKKKGAFITAFHAYSIARGENPVAWHSTMKKPFKMRLNFDGKFRTITIDGQRARFVTIMREMKAGKRRIPEGGRTPYDKYVWPVTWISATPTGKEEKHWNRLKLAFLAIPKFAERDRAAKAKVEAGGIPDPEQRVAEEQRQQLLQLNQQIQAQKKAEKDRADLIKLHGMIEAKKKKDRAKKRRARKRDTKRVARAAKRKDRKTAKKLGKKSKDLDKLRERRTKATIRARNEAKRLRRKLASLKRQLAAQKAKPATAATRKKERELKREAEAALEQEEFARRTNVIGNLLTKNAAAQAAIVKQMAAATASGNAVQAAALAKAYDRLAAAATGLRAIREAQLKNMKG